MKELRTYTAWDVPTRWFHWINVLCVLALMGLGLVILFASDLGIGDAGKISLKTLHVYIGYVFATNLAWRLIWAFWGNQYARWRSWLPGGRGYWTALRSYAAAFTAGRPEPYVGHNPLGRIGVAILFILLLIQAITGLVLAGTDLFLPPFGHWIGQWIAADGVAPETLVPYAKAMYDPDAYERMRAFRKPFITLHLYTFYTLGCVVVVHVAAVVITELREGGGIISAMFTGHKIFGDKPVDAPDNDSNDSL